MGYVGLDEDVGETGIDMYDSSCQAPRIRKRNSDAVSGGLGSGPIFQKLTRRVPYRLKAISWCPILANVTKIRYSNCAFSCQGIPPIVIAESALVRAKTEPAYMKYRVMAFGDAERSCPIVWGNE